LETAFLKIIRLDTNFSSVHSQELLQNEQGIFYPLGEDSFEIHHGENYFAFFKRLGKVVGYAALDKNEIIGHGIGILRSIKGRKSWYLCDLKVKESYRRKGIPFKIFKHAFLPHYFQCRRGYAISMDPPSGENKMVRYLSRLPFTPLKIATNLQFFSLSSHEMKKVRPFLEDHFGQISYLSLKGIKDLKMRSSGKNLPLWHVQWGEFAQPQVQEEQSEGVHMFCLPLDHPLIDQLKSLNFIPQASAHVLQRGMDHIKWDFILTSDI
jgi:GNAT superfamily N-acetyltransferase